MKAPERAFSLLKVLHYMCLNGCLVLCLKRYFLVQVDTFKKEEALYLDTVKQHEGSLTAPEKTRDTVGLQQREDVGWWGMLSRAGPGTARLRVTAPGQP